jgi:hypothetical protein
VQKRESRKTHDHKICHLPKFEVGQKDGASKFRPPLDEISLTKAADSWRMVIDFLRQRSKLQIVDCVLL